MTKIRNFLILFTALFSFESWASDPMEISTQYPLMRDIIKDQDAEVESQALSSYKIMLVPGQWTKIFPRLLQKLGHLGVPLPKDLLMNFKDQLTYYQGIGVDVEVAPIDTLRTCEQNADELSGVILESPKKVLLITHSKGGLDILHLLVKYPELRPKIAGWISFQSPFMGSPLTDWPLANSWFGRGQKWLINLVLGGGESIECMSPDYRNKYFEDHQEDISQALQEIPMISFGSHVEPLFSWRNFSPSKTSLLNPFGMWLSQRPGSQQNDGLVPTQSSCLPESSCLVLQDMDHAGPVMDVPPFFSLKTPERLLLTRTLVSLILKRPALD